MGICNKCGYQFSPDSTFCSGCGTPVASHASPQPQFTPPQYAPPPQPQYASPQYPQSYPPQQYPPLYPQQPYAPQQAPFGTWQGNPHPQQYWQQQAPPRNNPHNIAARGITQIFAIHPAVAVLTIAVDLMLFGKDGLLALLAGPTAGISLGLALIISVCAGCILGVIAYFGQRKWYGDDKESAAIKALILAFLTAIPTSIPSLLFASFGLLGFFRKKS